MFGRGWDLARAAIVVAAAAVVPPPPPAAAPTTLGSPLTAPFEFAGHCNFPAGCEVVALDMPEPGAQTASPLDGTVVRWRAMGTTAGQPYPVSALRAEAGGAFTSTAVSAVAISAGAPLEVVAVELPIHVG